jgi:hypothetical protein
VFVAVRGPRQGARASDLDEGAPGRRGTRRGERGEAAPGCGEAASERRFAELRVTPAALAAARRHCVCWADRLEALRPPIFRAADRRTFYRACLVAAALGRFDSPGRPAPAAGAVPLAALLDEAPPGARAEGE